jgi:thiamine-monophosphate kinase
MGEFDVIERFFKAPARLLSPRSASHCANWLGIGDDCAVLPLQSQTQLAVTSDMLVQGTHFFTDTCARRLGHKALAVNLSDLAACGARPIAFTLALAIPEVHEDWLSEFSAGLFELAHAHGCVLIGGDTTRGPLNLCLTALGEIDLKDGQAQTLLRSGGQIGDDVYVSGQLGDARLALLALQGRLDLPPVLVDQLLPAARLRLEQPQPRVALGLALRGLAHAAMDVSDGLIGDLSHLLQASSAGRKSPIAAHLYQSELMGLMASARQTPLPDALVQGCVLTGGDDYELLFCAAASERTAIVQAAQGCHTPVTRIGQLVAGTGIHLCQTEGTEPRHLEPTRYGSYNHFA